MSEFNIKATDTENKDIVISSSEGFPALYVGRGSYCALLDVRSYSFINGGHNEVHLIYIGRYTSIGDNVRIYCNLNHDHRSVYMGTILDYGQETPDNDYRAKIGQTTAHLKEKGTVVIGNDVWIGDNVTIVADVTIGNGAVIGTGSVLRKDVPPYTIWAGNPARQIGSRFSEDIAASLQRISWWELAKDTIREMKADMQGEVAAFAQKYDTANDKFANRQSWEKPNMILAFVDIQTDFSTFGAVVEEFINKFKNDPSYGLIVAYHIGNEKEAETAELLNETLEGISIDSEILIVGLDYCEEEQLISKVGYMVLGRDSEFILRISYAFKYGVKLITGVGKNIFDRIEQEK